jgi:hypothetical protein
MNIVEHLENHLGLIQAGWKDSDGTPWPFQVLRFTGGPIADAVTYTTLGLSDNSLPSAVSAKQVRHELVFMARPAFCDRNIPAVLHQVGVETIRSASALLRGDVLGPRGALIEGTENDGSLRIAARLSARVISHVYVARRDLPHLCVARPHYLTRGRICRREQLETI